MQYESAVTGENETVKVEVAIREPILESTVSCAGRTLLRCPTCEQFSESTLRLTVLSLHETYAEKVRAALTRNPPAIRDIFDIAEAAIANHLDFSDRIFLKLVRQKLAAPGNEQVDKSETRRKLLKQQLTTALKPVLRSFDYEAFDFERAFAQVEKIAAMI